MRVTKEIPGKAGQGNIAGPMSTLWEGTTQVQALRNKAPKYGEGEMRQGQALTRRKSLLLCACVHCKYLEGISKCSQQ